MSNQPRRGSASPSSTLDSESVTYHRENKAPWQSPLLKPLPKKLEKPFKNALEVSTEQQGNFFGEVDEDEAFARYTSSWAKEDKELNFKKDQLEDLEDTMEAVMQVADRVVKLVTKLKRNIREN